MRHSREIQRVHDETYGDYVGLVRSMLTGLAKQEGALRLNQRTAAIGLIALLDGLWLECCLDPEDFSRRDAIRICEAWIARPRAGRQAGESNAAV